MSTSSKIIKKLIKKNISVSVAESCTGGLISHTFIEISGVSKIFSCGIICYSNKAKMKYLSVAKNTLKKYGAVSSNVALEMINNLYKLENTQLCIATTGVAGPKGGTKNKPVGLIFIGIKYNKKNYIHKKYFKGSRSNIQKKTKEFIFKEINKLI